MNKNNTKPTIQLRKQYKDHSRRFREWVRSLGFEKTLVGQWLFDIEQKLQLKRLGLIGAFCLLLASLIFSDIDFTYDVRVGEVANTDIKSPVNLELVDELATDAKRQEAAKTVPPVFDFDPNSYSRIYDRVYRGFLEMRRESRSVTWPMNPYKLEEAIKDFVVHKEAFDKELGVDVPRYIFEWLVENRFSVRLENLVIRTLAAWSVGYLTEGASKHVLGPNTDVIVRALKAGREGEERAISSKDLKEINSAQMFDLRGVRGSELLSGKEQKNVIALGRLLLMPNLTFNLKETDERRRAARNAVLPVQLKVAKNQVIVAEGQVITPTHMAVINEITELNSSRRKDFVSFVAASLFLTLILVFFSFLRRFTVNRVSVEVKDLYAMGTVAVTTTILTKLFVALTDQEIISRLGMGMVPSSALLYLAPTASAAMLVGLLITSGEVVWLFTVFIATVLAVMVDMNFGFLLVTIIGGIAAGRGVQACKQRNDIYRAGVRVGAINSITLLLLTLLQKLGDPGLISQLIWTVPAGFISGLLSAVVALALVPLLESWFNFTTDIKLLELASLNHPLMKEMIVKAPGTYHHSLVVGSMCEAAAEEIGANPLLAKVMAYYHDIGKTEHAQYFIENQRPGYNPHDDLSPHMSKTVLVAHVKDGAEMGYEHRLGKPIIDGILQHHGTTLISYFYNKALEEQNEDIHQVSEDDFRYPGPKPQFREAALVMLADSIEAAARSLDEPTAGRLQNIVKTVIQSKFLDGQLEECNLTLKDLTVIENAYKRILLGVYHHRIDYPMRSTGTKNVFKAAKANKGSTN